MQDAAINFDKMTERKGIAAILGVGVIQGMLAGYWLWLMHVPAIEVSGYRAIFGCLTLLLLFFIPGTLKEFKEDCKNPRNWTFIGAASLVNYLIWFLLPWSVQNNYVLEMGLGQYIQPLGCILSGLIIFHQKLSRLKVIALLVAGSGVLAMAVLYGTIPWLALTVGLMSAAYLVLRKQAPMSTSTGLILETALNAFLAIIILGFYHNSTDATILNYDFDTIALLYGAGALTVGIQLVFVYGISRVSMVTIGFSSYITPTVTVLIGLIFANEVLEGAKLVGFIFIWVALSIYSVDILKTAKKGSEEHSTE